MDVLSLGIVHNLIELSQKGEKYATYTASI